MSAKAINPPKTQALQPESAQASAGGAVGNGPSTHKFYGLPPQKAEPSVLARAMNDGQPAQSVPAGSSSRQLGDSAAVEQATRRERKMSEGAEALQHGPTGYMDMDRAGLGGDEALSMLARDVMDLYGCNPRDEIFARSYAQEAVFEDPLGRLTGVQAVRRAFKGLAEVFEHQGWDKEGARFQLVDVDAGGRRLRFEIECHYRVKPSPLVLPFKATTTILLTGSENTGRAAAGANVEHGMPQGDAPPSYQSLTDTLLIREHTDAWFGVPLATPENAGWVGQLSEWRRKATGLMQEAFVRATGGEEAYGKGHGLNT